MSNPHKDWIYPEDVLPTEAALWWRDNVELFCSILLSPRYHKAVFGSNMSGNLLIYPPKCNKMENTMNGRKSTRTKPQSSNGDAQSLPLRWINLPLTPEDLDTLGQTEINCEQLALAYIELGSHGLGLSVKYDSFRKQYSVSIYGSDVSNHGQPCGISGAAPNLWDAILVSLFRFNSRLQGSFDGSTLNNPDIQPARFR